MNKRIVKSLFLGLNAGIVYFGIKQELMVISNTLSMHNDIAN